MIVKSINNIINSDSPLLGKHFIAKFAMSPTGTFRAIGEHDILRKVFASSDIRKSPLFANQQVRKIEGASHAAECYSNVINRKVSCYFEYPVVEPCGGAAYKDCRKQLTFYFYNKNYEKSFICDTCSRRLMF